MPDQTARPKKKKDQAVNLDTLGLEMGTVPPQALDAEESVLGAMLLEPSCVDEAMEELTPSCFYDPKHKMIFEAMSSLVTEHVAVDMITVSNKLKSQGKLSDVGGAVALADLSQKVGAAANMEFYIKILKQKTIQRDLITASYDILKDSYDDSVKVDDLIDMAQTKVYAAIQNNVKKEVQDIGSIINSALSEIEKLQGTEGPTGVPSGFPSIDRITQGWQASDLIILAARPSVGKTAFALNLARNAAVVHHMPVAFFSLEMSAIQLGKRLMTSESGLSADKIKGGVKLEPYEWEQLEYKLKSLAKAPLYIDDTPGIGIMEIKNKPEPKIKIIEHRLLNYSEDDYLTFELSKIDFESLSPHEPVYLFEKHCPNTLPICTTVKDINANNFTTYAGYRVRKDGNVYGGSRGNEMFACRQTTRVIYLVQKLKAYKIIIESLKEMMGRFNGIEVITLSSILMKLSTQKK